MQISQHLFCQLQQAVGATAAASSNSSMPALQSVSIAGGELSQPQW